MQNSNLRGARARKSFTKTKDRIWAGYDDFAAWLARRPGPVRRSGDGVFGALLWTADVLPGNSVRPTFVALAKQANAGPPRPLFRRFVRQFVRGMDRIEQVRHGYTDAIDDMLRMPEQDRLDAMLAKGGAVLAIPHTHASLAMGRGLGRKYPILALVRSTATEKRAASEWEIYENLGCVFVDIRLEKPTTVARKVLAALNAGRLVVGTVDRIREAPPPDDPIDSRHDTVRVSAFGEPIGLTGWPARFTPKSGSPIVAATVVQTADAITLELGEAVHPTDDITQTSQAWIAELEKLFRQHPEEWTFALDKHWSRVLRNSVDR